MPQGISDFLELENPNFDLRELARSAVNKTENKKPPRDLLFDFRDSLVVQPPLGKNEHFPASLALFPGEVALSSTPLEHYSLVEELDLYAPNRHFMVVDLIRQEFITGKVLELKNAHGTIESYRAGCNGPLCRRANREHHAVMNEIRRKVRQYKLAKARSAMVNGSASATIAPPRPEAIKLDTPVQRLRRSRPQYVAVDPLQLCFTILSLLENPPKNPTKEQKLLLTLSTPELRYAYLTVQYPDMVK